MSGLTEMMAYFTIRVIDTLIIRHLINDCQAELVEALRQAQGDISTAVILLISAAAAPDKQRESYLRY